MKKKGRKTVVPSTPGKAYQYLIDNFSPVPDGGPLKNGHVMFLYADNQYSITKTIATERKTPNIMHYPSPPVEIGDRYFMQIQASDEG